MSSLPILPLFLQKGYLSQLNNQLFDKTGCFAFLCTDTVLCATEPKSWQDAFSIIVPGLYSVYHDYGCLFLPLLIDYIGHPGFQPDGFYVPSGIWQHIMAIDKTLRPNITHGILYKTNRDIFQTKISSYYLFSYYRAKGIKPPKPGQWPSFVENLDEEQWQYIVEKIVDDSNGLYDHLLNWSIEWEKRPDELQDLKKRFANDDYFKKSFDARICKPIVIASLREANIDLNQVDSYIKIDKTGSSVTPIINWQNEMVKEFLNGSNSDDLYTKLERIIRNEIITKNNQSSVSIARRFNLP